MFSNKALHMWYNLISFNWDTETMFAEIYEHKKCFQANLNTFAVSWGQLWSLLITLFLGCFFLNFQITYHLFRYDAQSFLRDLLSIGEAKHERGTVGNQELAKYGEYSSEMG